jgi:hypothetical protein
MRKHQIPPRARSTHSRSGLGAAQALKNPRSMWDALHVSYDAKQDSIAQSDSPWRYWNERGE